MLDCINDFFVSAIFMTYISFSSQIHAAAMCGQARILIELMEQEVVKNPPNDRRITPLHLAAENGFLSICKYIIDRIDDKNPGDETGRTPLHFAAQNGHIGICELIINNTDTKVCII